MDDRPEAKHLLAGYVALYQPFYATGGFPRVCCNWGWKTTNIQCLEPRFCKADFTGLQNICVKKCLTWLKAKKTLTFHSITPTGKLPPCWCSALSWMGFYYLCALICSSCHIHSSCGSLQIPQLLEELHHEQAQSQPIWTLILLWRVVNQNFKMWLFY